MAQNSEQSHVGNVRPVATELLCCLGGLWLALLGTVPGLALAGYLCPIPFCLAAVSLVGTRRRDRVWRLAGLGDRACGTMAWAHALERYTEGERDARRLWVQRDFTVAALLQRKSLAAFHLAEYSIAVTAGEEYLKLADQLGDPKIPVAQARLQLAQVLAQLHQYERALEILTPIRNGTEADPPLAVMLRMQLAAIHNGYGARKEATRMLDEAAGIAESLPEERRALSGSVSYMLGLQYVAQKNFPEGRAWLERALALFEEYGMKESLDAVLVHAGLSTLASRQGQPADGETIARQGLGILGKTDHPNPVAMAWLLLGLAANLRLQGRLEEAEDQAKHVVALLNHVRDDLRCDAFDELGRIREKQGRIDDALGLYWTVFEENRRRPWHENLILADDYRHRAELFSNAGRQKESSQLQDRAQRIVERFELV